MTKNVYKKRHALLHVPWAAARSSTHHTPEPALRGWYLPSRAHDHIMTHTVEISASQQIISSPDPRRDYTGLHSASGRPLWNPINGLIVDNIVLQYMSSGAKELVPLLRDTLRGLY